MMSETALVKQFKVGPIEVMVFNNKKALGEAAAQAVATILRQAIGQRGKANMVLATGASQYEFLDALREIEGVEWPAVAAFHLDEYLGISDQHPASFRRYLRERVFDHLPFGEIHLLEGDAPDPEAEAKRYAALLADRTIDVACIGIGENAHIAFNDPPADFDTPELVHIVNLDEACRRQQVGEGHFASIDEVPTRALSMSVPAILRARAISCVVPDLRKAKAVRCTLEGPITPDCPGSALRKHSNVKLYLDTDSASLLSKETTG